MWRSWDGLAALIIAVITTTVASSGEEWSKLPIPKYAKEVQKTTFLEGMARQISFVVDKPYPFDGVRDFYAAHLARSWRICTSDVTGWQGFIDGTRAPEVWVHQRLVHWVDKSRNRLVVLALRYESQAPADGTPVFKPANTRQRVVVAEYKEEDVGTAIRLLEIQCEGTRGGV